MISRAQRAFLSQVFSPFSLHTVSLGRVAAVSAHLCD